MTMIIDLNKVDDPLAAIRAEQGKPKPEPKWLFTAEEGAVVASIIKENEATFRGFFGRPLEDIEQEMNFAVLYIQKRAQRALKRDDFAFMPVYTEYTDAEGEKHRGFTINTARI